MPAAKTDLKHRTGFKYLHTTRVGTSALPVTSLLTKTTHLPGEVLFVDSFDQFYGGSDPSPTKTIGASGNITLDYRGETMLNDGDNWGLNRNRISGPWNTGNNGIAFETGETDIEMEFVYRFIGNGNMGSSHRFQSSGNWQWEWAFNVGMEVFREIGGSSGSISGFQNTTDFVSETQYTVRVRTFGSNIKVWIDGVLYINGNWLISFDSETHNGFMHGGSLNEKWFNHMIIRKASADIAAS